MLLLWLCLLFSFCKAFRFRLEVVGFGKGKFSFTRDIEYGFVVVGSKQVSLRRSLMIDGRCIASSAVLLFGCGIGRRVWDVSVLFWLLLLLLLFFFFLSYSMGFVLQACELV